jgi:hypothetical protein
VAFPFFVKCFPVIILLVFNFLLSEDSNRAEFIGKYSASDLVIIFMFSSKKPSLGILSCSFDWLFPPLVLPQIDTIKT